MLFLLSPYRSKSFRASTILCCRFLARCITLTTLSFVGNNKLHLKDPRHVFRRNLSYIYCAFSLDSPIHLLLHSLLHQFRFFTTSLRIPMSLIRNKVNKGAIFYSFCFHARLKDRYPEGPADSSTRHP